MTIDGYQQQYLYAFQGVPTSYNVVIPGVSVFSNQNQSYGGAVWGAPISLTGDHNFSSFSTQGLPYAFPGFGDIIQSFASSQSGEYLQGLPQDLSGIFDPEAEPLVTNSTLDPSDSITPTPASGPSPGSGEQPLPENPDGDVIKGDTKQGGVGDCFFLSGTKAISETEKGRQLIDQSVKSNPDGSYDVTFKGDPSKTYHVNKEDLSEKFVSGDPTMQALCTAGDQYFKDHGQKDGIASGGDPRSVFELFGGDEGTKTEIEASRSGDGPTKDDIKKYLNDTALDIGKNTALTLIGTVDDKGNWAPADPSGGHVFQVTNIDKRSGTVTYTNPWDTSQKRTISIDDLATQMTKDGMDNGALVGRTYS